MPPKPGLNHIIHIHAFCVTCSTCCRNPSSVEPATLEISGSISMSELVNI